MKVAAKLRVEPRIEMGMTSLSNSSILLSIGEGIYNIKATKGTIEDVMEV